MTFDSWDMINLENRESNNYWDNKQTSHPLIVAPVCLYKPQVLQESRSWLSDLGIAYPKILPGGNTCREGWTLHLRTRPCTFLGSCTTGCRTSPCGGVPEQCSCHAPFPTCCWTPQLSQNVKQVKKTGRLALYTDLPEEVNSTCDSATQCHKKKHSYI